MKETFKIVKGKGCGCFLDPPSYPTHFYTVEEYRGRKLCGFMSLENATESQWLPAEVREQAQALLDGWEKPPLDDPATKDWVHQVLGYFRGCYVGEDGDRKVENLIICKDAQALGLPLDRHAGVLLIRDFYPEFTPGPDEWASAYWGTKPSKKEEAA